MTEHEALFLFLMAIGAFFMPFISKRLLLPAAVGEIIYGIVIVSVLPHGENQLEMVEYFSALGFLILMYLAGLEIDFDRFRDRSEERRVGKEFYSSGCCCMVFIILLKSALVICYYIFHIRYRAFVSSS